MQLIANMFVIKVIVHSGDVYKQHYFCYYYKKLKIEYLNLILN